MDGLAFVLFLMTLLVGWGAGFITGLHMPFSVRTSAMALERAGLEIAWAEGYTQARDHERQKREMHDGG